jgi:hypothetical protein
MKKEAFAQKIVIYIYYEKHPALLQFHKKIHQTRPRATARKANLLVHLKRT